MFCALTRPFSLALPPPSARRQWLRAQNPPCDWDSFVCSNAAEKGHLDILKWARAHGCEWNADVCTAAAATGQLEVLKWLRSQSPPCSWDTDTVLMAAQNNHLDVLQWARAQSPPAPWNAKTTEAAAEKAHFEVLQWLRTQSPPCDWSSNLPLVAARKGHIGILRWVRAQNPPCPWSFEKCCQAAIDSKNAETLDWFKSFPEYKHLNVLGTNEELARQQAEAAEEAEKRQAKMNARLAKIQAIADSYT